MDKQIYDIAKKIADESVQEIYKLIDSKHRSYIEYLEKELEKKNILDASPNNKQELLLEEQEKIEKFFRKFTDGELINYLQCNYIVNEYVIYKISISERSRYPQFTNFTYSIKNLTNEEKYYFHGRGKILYSLPEENVLPKIFNVSELDVTNDTHPHYPIYFRTLKMLPWMTNF